ncbi:Sec7-domain-containing protein [Piromyces finnis]|uniref:Sec7-domain-containing protein n=1 Tax=Piromyces finnis TaxID=1754191 RepID=A0A1Y1VNV2_9FUNG|nr:Sec7-domain-containing protein [Piromyces finnis]|eukprot:ORX61066.1 Sec7-domain-containing protein [Piromyces finnis]
MSKGRNLDSFPELKWTYIINSEIVSLINVMRKNQRWSISISNILERSNSNISKNQITALSIMGGKKYYENLMNAEDISTNVKYEKNNKLLQDLIKLQNRLPYIHSVSELDPFELLYPFLEIIRSGETTGPITGAALSSVEKFIKYEIINIKHPNLYYAISALVTSVTHCKFEATDVASDEVVLSQILRLLQVTATSKAGKYGLDDKAICEMVEAAFGMCFQVRVNELLRRSAEHTLVVLIQVAFTRLSKTIYLDSQILKETLTIKPQVPKSDKTESENEVSILKYENHQKSRSTSIITNKINDTHTKRQVQQYPTEKVFLMDTTMAKEEEPLIEQEKMEETFIPFGKPAILETLSVLVSLVNPKDKKHTDSIHRIVAIRLLNTVLEVGGQSLKKWIEIAEKVEKNLSSTNKNKHRRNSSVQIDPRKELKMSSKGDNIVDDKQFVQVGNFNINVDQNNENSSEMKDSEESPNSSNGNLIKVNDSNNNIQESSNSLNESDIPSIESLENLLSEEESMALTIKDLLLNELFKHLFLLIRMESLTFASPPSSNTLSLLSAALRLIIALFQIFHGHLKHQLEFFMIYIMNQIDCGVVVWDLNEFIVDNKNSSKNHDSSESLNNQENKSEPSSNSNTVDENKTKFATDNQGFNTLQRNQRQRNSNWSIVPEVRELFLQCILQLVQIPTFITDLYVNYDGSISSQNNLFEIFVYFLSKHAFPDCTPGGPVTSSIHQIICLDGLLSFLKGIVDRSCSKSYKPNSNELLFLSPELLLDHKQKKEIWKEGARRFNVKPKQGIDFLQKHKFLPTPVDSYSLAIFLKSTPQVNKKALGEFIAKPDNVDLLAAFISLYDFHNKRLDEAIRMMLESFRLPGESQQIERILQAFSRHYYISSKESGDKEFANEDAAFILSYAIVMLNTDQHNPQVRNKMTFNDFKRNVSGINDGKDLSIEYLTKIFNAIRESEIIMPEEHDGELGFNYQWRELIQRSKTDNAFTICDTAIYDKNMFVATCNLTIAAISYAFDTAEDDITIQKAIIGLHYCTLIAKKFKMNNIIDNVINSLSLLSGLQNETPENYDPLAKPKTLDKWSVEFGSNTKGQVASLLMFDIIADYGNNIIGGWKNIMQCINNLFLHSLLPESLTEYEDVIRGKSQIPHLITAKPVKKSDSIRRDAGFISTLFQFALAQQNEDNYQPTQEELAAQHFTSECIKSSRISDIFNNIKTMSKESLIELCNAMIQYSFKSIKRTTSLKNINKQVQNMEKNDSSTNSLTSNESLTHQYFVEQINSINNSKQSLPNSSTKNLQSPRNGNNKIEFSTAALFFLNWLTKITIENADRVEELWTIAFDHCIEILKNASYCPSYLIEHTVFSLMKLCRKLIELNIKPELVISTFESLKLIPTNIMNDISDPLMADVDILVKEAPQYIKDNNIWAHIIDLISLNSTTFLSSKYTFNTMVTLIDESLKAPESSAVSQENFGDIVDFLIGFMATISMNGGDNERNKKTNQSSKISKNNKSNDLTNEYALKALEKLYSLHSLIPYLIRSTGMRSERAWFEFWLPILSGLGQQCYHSCKEVRQSALVYLKRNLLSNDLESNSNANFWSDCFDNVLFPLLEELLKKEVYNLDPSGMDETMARASDLMCKIFLHYFSKINAKELERIWSDILQYLCRYLLAAKSEFLKEGVIESIKNILLVMYAQGVFYKSPEEANKPDPEYNELWNLTWKILSHVLPKLKSELFSSKGTFTPVVQSPTTSSKFNSTVNLNESENITDNNGENTNIEETQVNSTSDNTNTGTS